jgi:hypothetical protein
MTKIVVALYDDIVIARRVVEELVNADFPRSDISLITNDANNQYQQYSDATYIPQDDAVTAVDGAGFGAVVGALTGLLAGAAALMIPGIGLAIVAGPIVAVLTGTVAGAVTGGIVGALVKSGMPEDEAPYYAEGIRRGGTLISIETSDTLRAQDVLDRQGSINIHERSNLWRREGWQGFNTETNNNDATVEPVPVMVSASVMDTTTAKLMPMPHPVSPITVVPATTMPLLIVEPPIESDDTAKTLEAMMSCPLNKCLWCLKKKHLRITRTPSNNVGRSKIATDSNGNRYAAQGRYLRKR